MSKHDATKKFLTALAAELKKGDMVLKMSNVKEGDFVMTAHGSDEEVHVGQVVHVMREGMLGVPGGEYSLEASAENPAVLIQLFEQEENGFWEATNLYTGCMMSLVVAIDTLPQEPELKDMETSMAGEMMYAAKAVSKSMYRVVQDNPGCSSGFAVVDEDGELEGCFETREEANSFAETNNKEEMMDSEVEMAMYDSSVGKRDYSTAARERMAEENTAMPDGSFPIANATDLRNAIQSVGRARDYNAAKQHIMRRARALGLVDQLPEDWKNSARKGMTGWGGTVFDLNPFVK